MERGLIVGSAINGTRGRSTAEETLCHELAPPTHGARRPPALVGPECSLGTAALTLRSALSENGFGTALPGAGRNGIGSPPPQLRIRRLHSANLPDGKRPSRANPEQPLAIRAGGNASKLDEHVSRWRIF